MRGLEIRQLFTRHPIARLLPLALDAEALQGDLAAIPEAWWRAHLGPYHDGGWQSVSLWAPRGDLHEQRGLGGAFAATAALERSPHLRASLEALPGDRSRVRLMRLLPGARIYRHSDPVERVGVGLLRLHVAITTNPDVSFLVAGQRIAMRPGEVWHVDVRFPHEVRNAGTEPRVHLVLDVFPSPQLLALLARATPAGRGFLTLYFLKHALPYRVRRCFGIGN